MMIFTAKTYYSTLILLLEFSCPSVSSSLRLPIRSFVPIFEICVRCIPVKCMGVWVTWPEHPKGTKIANQLILQQNRVNFIFLHLLCGKIRNFSTIVKILEFSTSVMWRNLKFHYMFQISPHLPCIEIWNFSTWQIFLPMSHMWTLWQIWGMFAPNIRPALNICEREICLILKWDGK